MRLRLATLLFAAWFCQGCFVLEEIDKGQALMDAHSPERNERRREEAKQQKYAGRKPAEPEETSLLASVTTTVTEKAKTLWTDLTTEAPPERDPDDTVVRCQLEQGVQYMRRSDCWLRRGNSG